MDYQNTLNAYHAILLANPGHALDLGSNTVAILQEGMLRAAHRHVDGRIDLHKAFEFIEDAWDEDSECWESQDCAADTLRFIERPVLIPVNLAHQKALKAMYHGEWDCPELEAVGLLGPSNIERMHAIYAHYGLTAPY